MILLESAEIGHCVDDGTYAREVPALREALIDLQFDLSERRTCPMIIVIAGMVGAGKGETVNRLHEWLEPRYLETHAFPDPSDEERERPPLWRFWRVLPPKGRSAILFDAWYGDALVQRVLRTTTNAAFDRCVTEIQRFERMLCDEGGLLLKFWFHLSKSAQKQRLKSLEADPRTRWRVNKTDWRHYRHYDRLHRYAGHMLRVTDSAAAPWRVVESSDANYRNLTVGRALREALRERLAANDEPPRAGAAPATLSAPAQRNKLSSLKLDRPLGKKSYERQLARWQAELNGLARHKGLRRRSVVMVFEGPDAGGKGGSIRRVTAALDARYFKVIRIATPNDEELAQPYLWRFWRHVPRHGHFTIYDRSWYGRVLVERVDALCAEADWMRAYAEINDFEEALVLHGTLVVKYWLAIGKDEQLRRFEERERIGFKRYKLTEADWRNRAKWEDYAVAAGDLIDRTSTSLAPWTLVEANDKHYARIKVLETLCKRLETALAAAH